ncbi:Cdc37 N terminal kinase binding-domain-containing protein [Lactarius hengduanensis]|nr:Cdc37 N terminal kinase binding-domain-containing protein [Lactarius hengduanensis]
MPLNYSKWDQLEVSDDSDIEGHPNVDKKSLIRWKQRDIHEKREVRNHRIEQLEAEVACNDVLLARLRALQPKLAQSGSPYFSSEVDRLRTNPSPEAPPTNAAKPVPYDEMILTLLQNIAKEAQENAGSDTAKLDKLLEERLDFHANKLSSITEERRKERDTLLKEKSKLITMDDLHEGFESKYVPAKPEPAPVINRPLRSNSSTRPRASDDDDDDDGEVALPHMTPSLEEFAKLPLWDFEKLWLFIQSHREVVVTGASDALLVAAFRAQRDGKSKYAKQCVHQSLVLQYGEKLGKDGVQLFFKRMAAGGENAQAIFRKDVEDTYGHIQEEAEAVAGGEEQIQLVAENPDTVISFNVPDGPPPEHLVLEGPETEGMDIEEVRKVLQMRWDLFCGFPRTCKRPSRQMISRSSTRSSGICRSVSRRNAVKALDMGGILNFSEEGIRDETGRAAQEEDDANEAEDLS